MHNFIQRNKKKLLAVFGVLLMIVFILPTTFSGRGQFDYPIGKVGDAKVTGGDLERASRELRALGVLSQTLVGQTPEERFEADIMGLLAGQYRDKPITYVLLQKEAAAAGVVPAEDAVEKLAADVQNLTRVMSVDVTPHELARHFLQVAGNMYRAQGRVKVTVPEVMQAVAVRQQPTANLVEFKVEDYLKTVSAPKPEDVQGVYDRYAAVEPRPLSAAFAATQPVQFGYLRPTKVKLQYLPIPRAALGEAAVASLSPDELYELDRVAVGYYRANPTEFEVKVDPTLFYGPTTSPTVKRFATVRDEIRRKLLLTKDAQPPADTSAELSAKLQALRAKVDKRVDELRAQVTDKLAADYRAHQKGEPVVVAPSPATQPATGGSAAAQPATAPATRPTTFESPEYLDAVLAEVLRKAGGTATAGGGATVAPAAGRHAKALDDKWYTAAALNEAEGINLASAGGDTFAALAVRTTPAAPPATGPATAPAAGTGPAATSQPATSPAATGPATSVAATGPASRPTAASAWALYQPSPLLVSGSAGDAYVFRLTAFEGERVPSLDEVRDQIEMDLRRNEAFAEAGKQAQTLLEAARSSANRPEGGLPSVAELAGRKVFVVGPLDVTSPEVPGYPLADAAGADVLRAGIMSLVSKASVAQPHPTTTVGLAAAEKVLAVELRSLERGWTKDRDFIEQRQIADRFGQPQLQRLLAAWLAPEQVAKRTNYVPSGG